VQPDRIRLEAYQPAHEVFWNRFVATSKNGTFLFDRGYMDYHADRFVDASYVAFEGEGDDNIVALLPASLHDKRIISHGGLTYGGWITDHRMTMPAMLYLFQLLKDTAKAVGVQSLTYKAVPRCYHRLPAEEDLYALFAHQGLLMRQDATSIIELAAAPSWAKGRKQALMKARKSGINVVTSKDFSTFVANLSQALARHGAAPVHSVAELELLSERFPANIRLYEARLESEVVANALIYDCGQTVHTQYLATTETGRSCGGLEAIIHQVQHLDYADRRYLSFGISTEQEGRFLNEGLVRQKEMFGARTMICPFYELDLSR
jgi:hypothetical protein